MQTTFKDLFGISKIEDRIEIKTFTDAGGGMISFTFLHRFVTCSMSIPKAEFAKLLLKGEKLSPPSNTMIIDRAPRKRGIKEELISDEEMNGPQSLDKRQTRNIRCPKTGNLITSAEFQKNKAEGLYAGLPVVNGRIRPMGDELKPQ